MRRHGQPQRTGSSRAELVSVQPLAVAGQAEEPIDVLLVEDDAAIREMFRLRLALDGYRVTTAADGAEGIATAKALLPDIIFLDVQMPKKDGFEVLMELRADPSTVHIPVIILSNYDQSELIKRGLALGATEYLIKSSTTPGSLCDGIDEWIGR
jgi:CheY-like chemotaxis protein